MTGLLAGQVAVVTGAARGQGRSHALALAKEGASIIALDACAPIATVPYPLSTKADLETTAEQVEALGGRVIITSSAATAMISQNIAHYTAAKHGLIGFMRVLAKELAPHRIRVNTLHPTGVRTPMIFNEPMYRLFRPDLEN